MKKLLLLLTDTVKPDEPDPEQPIAVFAAKYRVARMDITVDVKRWPIDKQYTTEIYRMEKWLDSRIAYMDKMENGYPAGYK